MAVSRVIRPIPVQQIAKHSLFERLDRRYVDPEAYPAKREIPLSVVWNTGTKDYTLLHGYAAYDELDSVGQVQVMVYSVDSDEEMILMASLLHNRAELEYWDAVDVLLQYRNIHPSNPILSRLTGWKESTVKRHCQIIKRLDPASISEAKSHNVKLTTWDLVQQIVNSGYAEGYATAVHVRELEKKTQGVLQALLRFIRLPEFLALSASDKAAIFTEAVPMVNGQHNERAIAEALNIIIPTNPEQLERFLTVLQNLVSLSSNVEWGSVSEEYLANIEAYLQQILDGIRPGVTVI